MLPRRDWPTIFLGASLVPSALLIGFILWFMFWYRPSGQERWGDAVAIARVGVLTYPASLLLLGMGAVIALRRPLSASLSRAFMPLFVASCVLLVFPWFLLWLGSQ